MSQVEVPEEIEHLDFEPEKAQAKRHWVDPIRRDYWWCGEKMLASNVSSYTGSGTLQTSKVTCVKCLQLGISLGLKWWWQTHIKFYGSSCKSGYHDCGA